MSCDEFSNWMQSQDQEALYKGFLTLKGLLDAFDEYCMGQWQSDKADYEDYLYEQSKDLTLDMEETEE